MRYPRPSAARRRQAGVTLIELMVALAIGMFLMAGAVTVFMQGRQTFRLTESIARLQENGRFALDAIEPDIRMASYWGLTTQSDQIEGRAAATLTADVGRDACGTNWAIDLDRPVTGSNGAYPWPCAGTGASATADTLTIRRVTEEETSASTVADTLYVQSSRFDAGRIFEGPTLPAGYNATAHDIHRLLATGYYIGTSELFGNAVPALRMKTLVRDQIRDEEVLPGVEDMQIQFGVDLDSVGAANRGSIDRYVNPGDAVLGLSHVEILAVRIWLRLRAEREEVGFIDTDAYEYADQDLPAPNDGFRRIVVSKTIFLRNVRSSAT
jgi:type IV pilus assembly protein PilW